MAAAAAMRPSGCKRGWELTRGVLAHPTARRSSVKMMPGLLGVGSGATEPPLARGGESAASAAGRRVEGEVGMGLCRYPTEAARKKIHKLQIEVQLDKSHL